jgi:protein-L-isoaspartate(D-aspartate) O-methyltransferase
MNVAQNDMIHRDLVARGIRDPLVIGAMAMVPREEFVPRRLAPQAYDDRPLPIPEGQTISQPYVVAWMTEALRLRSSDRVLEVGTGSGYAAAVVACIAREVYTIERHASLAETASQRLAHLGFHNVFVRIGDGTLGWPERAPFDAISVTASSPRAPSALLQQLAVGGRMVLPIGTEDDQWLIRILRVDERRFSAENLGSVQFVPLVGEEGWHERAEHQRG